MNESPSRKKWIKWSQFNLEPPPHMVTPSVFAKVEGWKWMLLHLPSLLRSPITLSILYVYVCQSLVYLFIRSLFAHIDIFGLLFDIFFFTMPFVMYHFYYGTKKSSKKTLKHIQYTTHKQNCIVRFRFERKEIHVSVCKSFLWMLHRR